MFCIYSTNSFQNQYQNINCLITFLSLCSHFSSQSLTVKLPLTHPIICCKKNSVYWKSEQECQCRKSCQLAIKLKQFSIYDISSLSLELLVVKISLEVSSNFGDSLTLGLQQCDLQGFSLQRSQNQVNFTLQYTQCLIYCRIVWKIKLFQKRSQKKQQLSFDLSIWQLNHSYISFKLILRQQSATQYFSITKIIFFQQGETMKNRLFLIAYPMLAYKKKHTISCSKDKVIYVQKELLVKMEKKQKNSELKKARRKLPTISPNKSHTNHQTKLPQILTPPTHTNDLRKLFMQNKSKAKILTNSPYYTNRQQNHELVSIIKNNKRKISSQQLSHITQKFALPQQAEQKLKNVPFMHYMIKMRVIGVQIDLALKARNVQDLQLLLKRQFAIQQIKSTGTLKQVQGIGGFESARPIYYLDYTLATKQNILASGKYDLRPWFIENVKSSVGIKDFRLIKCLGVGGFSLVYLARDKWKGDFYALKLIDKSFILESQRQNIVQNQRFVLGQLKSPFVTALKFSFQTKNHFVFAIQYCPGGELFYQLKKVKRMNQDEARFYFLEILIGLDYIHQKGIIYRDLKPENLLIGADGHIRIADFGLAKPLLGRQSAYSFCGSPQYMAPQMLLKSGHNSNLDYYCLGALLYELVVGLPPFYSLDHNQIYDGILNDELTFPDDISLSTQLESLLLSLLQKKSKKRLGCLYGVKQILAHPWIGKIKAKDIQEKKLQPPFMPNLANFNFDQSDLSQKSKAIQKKLQEDLVCTRFQSHFNSDFYYADLSLLPLTLKKDKSVKHVISKSLEKKRNSQSLLHRAVSQRKKSK